MYVRAVFRQLYCVLTLAASQPYSPTIAYETRSTYHTTAVLCT